MIVRSSVAAIGAALLLLSLAACEVNTPGAQPAPVVVQPAPQAPVIVAPTQ